MPKGLMKGQTRKRDKKSIKQRTRMKERYEEFRKVQEIIDKDTEGKGAKCLEATGSNDFEGMLFNHPALWFRGTNKTKQFKNDSEIGE
jgi:hypothetical protein